MTYQRVCPRDLFNEGNLLKCYGKLRIEMERYFTLEDIDTIAFIHDSYEPFIVGQNDDGDTTIINIEVYTKKDTLIELFRPINSRENYPLMFIDQDDYTDNVFTENGELTEEFKYFLLNC